LFKQGINYIVKVTFVAATLLEKKLAKKRLQEEYISKNPLDI
jgi:hypothetical protein